MAISKIKKSNTNSSLATELRDHGVPVRNGWCRAFKTWRDPATGRDYVYCAIFTTPALVVKLEAANGRCQTFRMTADCYWPWGIEMTQEGHVLVASSTGKLCRLDPKTGKMWVTADLGAWTWCIVPCGDSKYHLLTQTNRLFRYDSVTEKLEDLGPLDKQPKPVDLSVPERKLSDGRIVQYVDPEVISIGKGKSAKRFPLKYKADGTGIFHLAAGPNQTVVASTIMPLYLIRYTPATRKLENLGRGAPDNGEIYSFGHCDGKLYYACYSEGNLLCYDPAKPIRKEPPGAMKWKHNPHLLTNLGKGHLRPRALCIDSQKRIWVGSLPHKGTPHGGLGCYNIVTKEYVNKPIAIRDQSIWALAADSSGKTIYGGTTINTGVEPVTKEAQLFAWDAEKNKLKWKQVAIPTVTDYTNLLFQNGKVYGATGKPFSFFCFDPQKRAMDYVTPSEIGGAREHSICLGPDGNFYGITWLVLFRWRPETGKIEELYRCQGEDAKSLPGGSLFHRGAVIVNGRYYFSCGTKVMSLRLPEFI